MANATVFDSTATNPGGTGSTITVTLPTHAVGDIIYISIGNTGNTLWAGNPTGWNRITQQQVGTATNGLIGTWFWRKVVSGDTLPLTNPVFTLGATVTREAFARTIRGADLEGPFTLSEYAARAYNTGTTNPIRPATITTPAPEGLILLDYFSRAATNAPDQAGYTQDEEIVISGTLVGNATQKTVADQRTALSNQDASPTSGVRWVAGIVCVPSPDYPYYRSGSQAFNANGLNATPALPSGTTASDNRGNKDLIVATVECAGSPTIAPNTPGDWTALPDWSNTTSGGGTTVRKYWTLYDGSLDRQFNRSTSGEIFVYFSVYHNAHQSIPTGTSAVQQNASSTTSTFPALPRTGTKATVQATCVADATPTFTAPSGWTERNDSQGVTCADQSFNATGSTASASFTLNSASPTLAGLMEVFSVASVINLILTPATVNLTLTSFAPAVKLQITPAAASLSLTTFAPTVTTAAAQQYYRSLTIDHDLVPSTQTDFPVLVSFTDDDLKSVSNGGHVASTSGFDILFFSDAALTTQLSHELEKYDPVTGEVIAWVKLPTISGSTDTVFYVKYGDATITTSQEDAPDTWSNNFLGVWHLNGASLGTAKNSVTGGASTVSGPVAGAGQLDGGADYTGGASTDTLLTDITAAQPTNATYEIWAKREGEGGNGFGRMWVKGSVTNSELQFYNDAITYAPDEVYIFSAQWDGPSVVGNWSIPRPSGGAYHYLAVTYNNSSSSNDPLIYLDGSPATVTERITPSGSLVNNSGEKFAIGQRHLTTNRKWNGQLDEFRVSSVIRSPDWIALRSNNESDAAAFMAVGVELEVGDVLVTPAPATLATTRFAPTLKLVVTPAAASLALSAFAPDVVAGITPSLVLTTFAPTVSVGMTMAPASASLVLTTFSPSPTLSMTPATAVLTITAFAPRLSESLIPASTSLTLTTFAPSVTVRVTVTPTTAILSLTTFAPTVEATADVSVTPTTVSLTLTTFAVQLREVVMPASQSLALTGFAPKLAEIVTSGSTSLSLTTFASAVTTNTIVTPANTVLSLTTTAPQLRETVTTSAAALSVTTFAPVIEIDVTVAPDAQSLVLTGFAPVLREQLTPAAAALAITTFAPAIDISADITVTPSAASLALTRFAPALHEQVTPAAANLTLTTFAPEITVSADKVVQPANASLTLQTFAPQLQLIVTPASAMLSVSGNAPSLQLVIQPASTSLVLSTFAPTVAISGDITVTPAQTNLTLTTFAPVVTTGGVITTITPASATLTLPSYAPWLFLGLVPANRTYAVQSGQYEVQVSAGEYEFLDSYEDDEVLVS